MKLRLLLSLLMLTSAIALRAQITTVGLIGSATPDGWNSDVDMVQDTANADLWTLDILLVPGEAKFRANNEWTINWGDSAFPVGVGTQDGPNIPIAIGGMHHVTFNSATGEYHISVNSDIGIIGSATPFEWNSDINLYQDTADANLYTLSTGLAAGEAKFRQDDDWVINWGASDFPSGIGVQNGPNIPIPVGGDYNITFNKATGEYNFVLTSFSTVGIIGDATAGGWDTPTPMNSGSTAGAWTLNAVLVDGGLLFVGDDSVATWGGSDFPAGTATLDGDTIPVPAGRYLINFNTKTLEYEFLAVVYYETIGIIGDATPGGWDTDTDMERDAVDSSVWRLRLELLDGEAKFRANNEWVVDWGGATFPNGTAVLFGPNIPITAGEYNITFNSFTGAYSFFELQIYDRVGLVGTATPLGSWDIDFFLTKSDEDENVWEMTSIDLADGEAKFRADSAWTVNWGANSWPEGTGTQDGPNIPITAGTYGIVINTASGEYAFGDPLSSTRDLLNPASINAYPNPASDLLFIDLSEINLQGKVNLSVFDISGKMVLSEVQQSDSLLKLRLSGLQDGHYTLHISNDKYIIGKKFVVAR